MCTPHWLYGVGSQHRASVVMLPSAWGTGSMYLAGLEPSTVILKVQGTLAEETCRDSLTILKVIAMGRDYKLKTFEKHFLYRVPQHLVATN